MPEEKTKYFVVKQKAVPEVLLKVVEAKKLLESERVLTVQEATDRVGISRSSFYKYKEDIFPFYDNTKGKTVTFVVQMDDEQGLLSDLLHIVAVYKANILTIHQSIPVNGVATLTLSVEVKDNTGNISKMVEEIEEQELLESWLSAKKGQKVTIRVPKKGTKEKLVELAEENARMVLSKDKERLKREEGRTIGAVKEIASLLGLEQIIRMEAYDISNTNGFESVGSMVVYEKGKPKRNDYRKFKIKSVKVLTRRFTHGLKEREENAEAGKFTTFPDLILMDGGRGQVNIALQVLDELKLNIPVCGMVKDDNHRTRGLYYNNVEIPIDRNSEAFKLITRIQDEAHRFAIEFHRQLRGKGQVHSVLDDIEGIGPARRKALMRHYLSLDAIRSATVEELAQLPSMNEKAAESVYQFFHD